MPYKVKLPTNRSIYSAPTFAKRVQAVEFAETMEFQDPSQKAETYERKDGKWSLFTPSSFCRRCGRSLTDPKSVSHGIGPECIKKVGSLGNAILSKGCRIEPQTQFESQLPPLVKTHCHCGGNLETAPLMGYRHNNGYSITKNLEYTADNGEKITRTREYKLWLYKECPECGIQYTLWKLGIPFTHKFTE